jgi:hypothetical protein
MPDVVGQHKDQAEQIIRGDGFTTVKEEQEPDPVVPKNFVKATRPEAGPVNPAVTIATMIVSSGPDQGGNGNHGNGGHTTPAPEGGSNPIKRFGRGVVKGFTFGQVGRGENQKGH